MSSKLYADMKRQIKPNRWRYLIQIKNQLVKTGNCARLPANSSKKKKRKKKSIKSLKGLKVKRELQSDLSSKFANYKLLVSCQND